MRVASDGIGSIIDKIHGDDEKMSTSATDSSTSSRDEDEIKDLTNSHPISLNSATDLGVIVNAFLRIRDRHYDGDLKIRRAVTKLDGTISNPGSKHFNLSFLNYGKRFNFSIYENYVQYSDDKWFLRIYVTFPKYGPGKIHMFPLIDTETGYNHSHIVWSADKNEFSCTSDFSPEKIKTIFTYLASIEYYLGLSDRMIDINSYVEKEF